jgi:hypothetical protein
MTRKDFELIAAVLKNRRALAGDAGAFDTLARDFAEALAATNKQFNRDRFLRACGAPIN